MGITLGENDRILVATAEGEKQVKAEDNVSSGDVIRVVRIRTEEVTENEAVAYSTVYEDTEELMRAKRRRRPRAWKGEAKVTYTVTYADGEEENRVVKTKEVLKEAKSAVVLRGTKREAERLHGCFRRTVLLEYSLYGLLHCILCTGRRRHIHRRYTAGRLCRRRPKPHPVRFAAVHHRGGRLVDIWLLLRHGHRRSGHVRRHRGRPLLRYAGRLHRIRQT